MDDLSSYWQDVLPERCSCAWRVAHWSLWALKPYTSHGRWVASEMAASLFAASEPSNSTALSWWGLGQSLFPVSCQLLFCPLHCLPRWRLVLGLCLMVLTALRSPGYLFKAWILKAQTPDHGDLPPPSASHKRQNRVRWHCWLWPEESLSHQNPGLVL